MLKVVSTAQMRAIDREAVERGGMPELLLMENAGMQAYLHLHDLLGSLAGKRIGIFCGKGNNGGDGFVLARQLFTRGADPAVYLLAPRGELKGSAKTNMDAYANMGGRIKEFLDESDLRKHKIAIRHADALVDAILGTGIRAPLDGMYKIAVEKINAWKRFCLSLDIPSGVDSDKGAIHPVFVRADATITFGLPKIGMMFHPAADAVGKMKVADICFPPPLLAQTPCEAFLLDAPGVRAMLPARRADAHKGSFGHVVVAGGNEGMGGAVALASLAALRVGAGLATVAVALPLSRQFELGLPEVMSFPLEERLDHPANAKKILAFAAGKSALLLGPGMGRGPAMEALASAVAAAPVPLVLDADGLNNIAGRKEILSSRNSPTVVTPHPGEMARLTGKSADEINGDRLSAAKDFARAHNCVTVLKGARTVVAAPDSTAYINPTGNANLASGGTGDVLAGMIAGFMAQGAAPLHAAASAVYLHGLAADRYTALNDPFSLTASSLLAALPLALKEIAALPASRPDGNEDH